MINTKITCDDHDTRTPLTALRIFLPSPSTPSEPPAPADTSQRRAFSPQPLPHQAQPPVFTSTQPQPTPSLRAPLPLREV
ncbi:MAG: hypothetical protein LBR91_01530 [Puniceicoccales bacterium]|nr:hypothetical protein [Puniceicoccales bacterium]